MTNETEFTIRRFGVEEAPAMTAISADVGWNQPEEEIRGIIRRSGKYLLGAFCEGKLVGTAAAYAYHHPDGNFAYVNEVIVLSSHRKRGAATRLLEKLLPLTLADYPVLRLCATALGRPIYEKFGFEPFGTLSFGEFSGGEADEAGISPFAESDFPEAVEIDAANFGAHRSGVLAKLFGTASGAAWKLVRGGKMAGFIVRASMNWFLQCRDAEAFTALLAYANAKVPGVPALIREEHVKYLPGAFDEHFKLTLMQCGDAFPPPEASFSGFLPDIG